MSFQTYAVALAAIPCTKPTNAMHMANAPLYLNKETVAAGKDASAVAAAAASASG